MTERRQSERPPVVDWAAMEPGTPHYARLREHHLFSSLDAAQYDALVPHIPVREFEKGRILFRRGDPAEHFFFVDAGQVELTLDAPSGERKILDVVNPGYTFAEAVPFMGRSQYPVSAEVLEDCRLFYIPIANYVALLRNDAEACMRMLGRISIQLHARVREIERLTIHNARSRLAGYILDRVDEPADDSGEATVRLDLPRNVIASRLSITPETLSRLLRSLADEGIVTVEDRTLYVRDMARLREAY